MRIRVRLFAIQRELAGTREVPLELQDGGSVEDAWAALVARYPALAPGRAFVRFARNADYADAGTRLADGDELAVSPPVSGGTDSAVVPYPPLWVIYHLVTRDTISGGVLGPDQRISREDALRLVTRNHWYLTFE